MWPRPLNRGGRSMEALFLIIYTKYFWDFDMWPFNRVWPLNGCLFASIRGFDSSIRTRKHVHILELSSRP